VTANPRPALTNAEFSKMSPKLPSRKTVPVPAPSDGWRDLMQPFLVRCTREVVRSGLAGE
jgi:hypothetical protein